MFEKMGQEVAARRALRTAIAMNPGDSHAHADLQALDRGPAVLFRSGDQVWAADELLAGGRADDAWEVIRSARAVRGLQCMARVLGAKGDTTGVLGIWSRISP